VSNDRALQIGEQLLAHDPAHADEWRRLLVACHIGTGDAIQASNHARRDPQLDRNSVAHYHRALALAQQIAVSDPPSVEDLRRLAKAHARAAMVGQLGVHTGDAAFFHESLGLHRRAIELYRAVLARDPNNAQDRRSLAGALIMKSLVHTAAQQDLHVSLAECTEALTMHRELAAVDASNAEAQQDLSFAHYSTGRVCQLLGDLMAARHHYRQSLEILAPLVAAIPNNSETAFDQQRALQALKEIEEGVANGAAAP
jgi:tetratricopeptide (TPR) repeat protein